MDSTVDAGVVGREHITCDGPNCNESNPPKRCSKCKCTYYCSVECQRSHWKQEHKADCRDVGWMRRQHVQYLHGNDDEWGGEKAGSDSDAAEPTSSGAAKMNSSCYICLEEPIKDPFSIPGCGHVCCFSCLQQWQGFVKNTMRSTNSDPTDAAVIPSTNRPAITVTCPACRAVAPDIERTIFEKAQLYTVRANRHGLGEAERQEYRELAVAELEKVSDSNDAAMEFNALIAKADVLLLLERPQDAIEVINKVISLHLKGTQAAERIDNMIEQGMELADIGRNDEAEHIMEAAETLATSSACKRLPHHGFDAYEMLARAKEMMEDWEGAKEVYIENMLKKMTEPTVGTPPHQRMVWMGLSRCMYHLGKYDKAIHAGTAAIEMNRHFPQVHKYVALAQKENGDLEGARRTMARAVNYETPWDDENKRIVLEMYKDLMADD